MDTILPEELARFVRAVGPDPTPVQVEMAEHAAAEGFPTVGESVGGVLALLARMVDARRAFEFGSGFGYSASWLARALPADGEVVLTEEDAEELDLAREFFDRAGHVDRAAFEAGDAHDALERYDGPFDVVLIDHHKPRYREAFEAVRPLVPTGGVVVADNAMTAAPIDFAALLGLVEADVERSAALDDAEESAALDVSGEPAAPTDTGEPAGVDETDEHTRGIYDYLRRVRSDPAFETVALPVGEGIAVSYRTG